jgi:uncharacterized protein YqeY
MLMEKLKADLLAFRKAHDGDATKLMTTLVGEATAVGKNIGNRITTDPEVIALVKKFVNNAEETKAHMVRLGSDAVQVVEREIEILKGYLPKQMDEHELKAEIENFVKTAPAAAMKDVMAFLKEKFAGLYDGKKASDITKETLSKKD